MGVPLGIYTALRRNSLGDYAGRVFSLAGLSIPAFYLGILLMLLFGVQWDLFPVVGAGKRDILSSRLNHLVLPAFTLGANYDCLCNAHDTLCHAQHYGRRLCAHRPC